MYCSPGFFLEERRRLPRLPRSGFRSIFSRRLRARSSLRARAARALRFLAPALVPEFALRLLLPLVVRTATTTAAAFFFLRRFMRRAYLKMPARRRSARR